MSEGRLSTDPYKGVRDFYPEDWAKLQSVFNGARAVLSKWGYEEYNASPLEGAELYESKGNEEIVNEQTFTFTDRGDRRVTLRPEMTPSLARMVAARRRELAFPLRWFSIGNRFRYERPQKGRLREFYQTDIDLVGLPAGEADLEVITIASEILKSFGAKDSDFAIRINSRPMLARACELAGYADKDGMRKYWQLLDKKAKMSPEEFAKARGDGLDPLSIIEAAEDPIVKEEKEELAAMIQTLHARGITNAIYDPEIVRGFDYYTGVVFEITDSNPENARSLFGGGRYDGLVSLFGGDPIPAIGFAFGDVTFLDFLETHNLALPDATRAQVYIGTPSTDDLETARLFAEKLRSQGVRAFLNLTGKSLGDQIKDAVKRGIPHFVAYGKNEADAGTVRVKTLATSEEASLPVGAVAEYVTL